ncbi:MAG TPA: carboxypeptidase-like regulatory domain-containing protein, partial [Thermoanaerobaculaceae bacterium]|nr:carboxypeptidase-like regulatory domain-containing protein [Thermoanaerobaculaceae bacterium]
MLLLLVLVVATGQVAAQTSTGAIKGTVADAGGPLPGAQLTAVNTASGLKYDGNSREDGGFLMSGLVPGTYQLTATMDTFTPSTGTVVVQIGQTATVAFVLTPTTQVTAQVTVTAKAFEVAPVRSSEVATVVTTQQ